MLEIRAVVKSWMMSNPVTQEDLFLYMITTVKA
jgi:hypothetical protein